MDRLLVVVLGNRNAGKSHTWNLLFGREVRTGSHLRRLRLSDEDEAEVFLISGSPQERNKEVEEILGANRPTIVLCSLQYTTDALDTLDFFQRGGYFILLHWLNPGSSDISARPDEIGVVDRVLSTPSLIGIRNGQISAESRVEEIRHFVSGWARARDLALPTGARARSAPRASVTASAALP